MPDAAGRYDAARSAYVAAKDRDQLRFRAPEAFNEVIRRVAAHNGATVVESEAALSAAARNGIIGSDLMLEHVHPNAEGYFRLAAAYYPALVQWAGTPGVEVDEQTARAEMPLTEVDRLVHEPARLAVMSLLYVVDSADFTFLMNQTGLTWGNLSAHMSKLEEAVYVEVEKSFKGRRPNTSFRMTLQGREAFPPPAKSRLR